MSDSKKRAVRLSESATLARRREALMEDFFLEELHELRVDRHSFEIFVGSDPELADQEQDKSENLGEHGVEAYMADRFELNLRFLTNVDPKRNILVILSSCGGDVEAGMQMFSAILHCPNPVSVLAVKWARSMTSIIPLAADYFAIRPPARYMFHEGKESFQGIHREMRTENLEQHQSFELMLDIYATRLAEQGIYADKNMSQAQIKAKLQAEMRRNVDVWLHAREAVEWGFADAVYKGDPRTLRVKTKNRYRRRRMIECVNSVIKAEVKIRRENGR